MFDPGSGAQIHDFNPGVRQNGLFWTTIVDSSSVDVDLGAGTGSIEVEEIPQKDYFSFENAMLGNGPRPRMGIVSFRVEWTGIGPVNEYDNPAQKFRGNFQDAVAKMEWSGRSGDFVFQSAPLATSTTDAAEFGEEWNGSFY